MADIDAAELKMYLRSHNLKFQVVGGGNELLLDCPYCGKEEHLYMCLHPVRGKAKTARGISSGHHHCKVCGEGGTFLRFKREIGDLPNLWRPENKVKAFGGSLFLKGRQSLAAEEPSVMPPSGKAEEYHKALMDAADGKSESEGAIEAWQFLTEERCLPRDLIEKYKLGYAEPMIAFKEKGRKIKKKSPSITFPYFGQDKRCYLIKYRVLQKNEKGKNVYTRWPGCKSILFGLDHLDESEDYVIIVEGEFDALALREYGLSNVLSVPNGARNWDHSWAKQLIPFETVFLACDQDAVGQDGAKTVAEKVGKVRCRNVLLPLKDANQCLRAGLKVDEIQKAFDEAEAFPGCQIKEITELRDVLKRRLHGGEKTVGVSTGYENLDLLLVGWREKEVTILTGDTGTGKTTFTLGLVLRAAKKGMGVLLGNFEQPAEHLASKMCAMLAGKQFLELTDAELDRSMDELEKLPIYFLDAFGSVGLRSLKETIDYCARYIGISMFVFDPLQRAIDEDLQMTSEERKVYNEAIILIKGAAMEHGVHIFMIVHPTKLPNDRKGRKVEMNDLPASARIKQDVDNVLRLWVKEDASGVLTPIVELSALKVRSDIGRLGLAEYRFSADTLSYREVSKEEQEERKKKTRAKKTLTPEHREKARKDLWGDEGDDGEND